MFDATVNVINMDVRYEEGQEQAQLIFVAGIVLPLILQPGAPPLVVPGGALRIPLGKSALIELAEGIANVADRMPDEKPESGIILPTDANEADRIAQEMNHLRGTR